MRVTVKESIILVTISLTILVVFFSYSIAPKNYMKVSFLDVGQGDSILFQTPRGGKILVDGGPDTKVLSRLGETLPIYNKEIDILIATHDDADHIAGLIDVIKRYNVSVLLYSLPDSESSLSKELIRVAEERSTKVVHVTKPMLIKTDDGLLVKVLFPITNMDGAESNDASIATQFIFGTTKFMLTGDLSQNGEIFLVNRYGDELESNVLKLGHHGSDTSTHPSFLQNVKPTVAVISDGKNNSFGHPHQSVLDTVGKFGIKILRTDELGTISMYTNGLNIWQQ